MHGEQDGTGMENACHAWPQSSEGGCIIGLEHTFIETQTVLTIMLYT